MALIYILKNIFQEKVVFGKEKLQLNAIPIIRFNKFTLLNLVKWQCLLWRFTTPDFTSEHLFTVYM